MIVAGEVNYIVSIGELAICIEVRRVFRDSLIQQVDCFEQSRLCIAKQASFQERFRAAVEIERGDIGRGCLLDRSLFIRREFSLQLIGDRFRDFALNGENVG